MRIHAHIFAVGWSLVGLLAAQVVESDPPRRCQVSGRLFRLNAAGDPSPVGGVEVQVLKRRASQPPQLYASSRTDWRGRFSVPMLASPRSFGIAVLPDYKDGRLDMPVLVGEVMFRPQHDLDLGDLLVRSGAASSGFDRFRWQQYFAQEPVPVAEGEVSWLLRSSSSPRVAEPAEGEGRCRGVVRGLPSDGRLQGSAVAIDAAGEKVRRVRVDAAGSFDLGGLPAGTYRVAVSLDGTGVLEHRSQVRLLHGIEWLLGDGVAVRSAPVEIVAGESVDLDLQVPPPGRLRVEVRSNDRPVPWIRVLAMRPDAERPPEIDGDDFLVEGQVGEAETGIDGSCEFTALREGRWQLWWRQRGDPLSAGPVDIVLAPGDDRRIELRLGTAEVRGRIDPNWWAAFGKETPALRLFRADMLEVQAYGTLFLERHVSSPYLGIAATPLEVDGRFALPRVPTGRYVLRVSTGGAQWPMQRVVVVEDDQALEIGDWRPECYEVRRTIDMEPIRDLVGGYATLVIRQRLAGFDHPATLGSVRFAEQFVAELPLGAYEVELQVWSGFGNRLTGWKAELVVGEGPPAREVLRFAKD